MNLEIFEKEIINYNKQIKEKIESFNSLEGSISFFPSFSLLSFK